MMDAPKMVWIVFDKMDGPHIFKSKKQADKTMDAWAREAKDNAHDSFWEMVGPVEYKSVEEG